MATVIGPVIGQSTDPNQPGVLGQPEPGFVPGTLAIGVKGDGGSGFPPVVPAGLKGRQGIGVLGTSSDPNGFGVLGNNTAGIGVRGYSTGFDAVVGETQSNAHAGVTGRNLTTGGVGVYGTGGQFAGKFDGALQVNGDAQVNGALGATSAGPAAAIIATNTNPVLGAAIIATSTSPVAAIEVTNKNGPAGQFGGDVGVTGTLTVSTDIILTGADCAEEFDIATDHAIEPGTVMVLDEAGSLCASERAYDRNVAGVISGGGDYKPGLILDRGNSSQKRLPLALVGKVYCKVDAQFGAIGIGDLLTTSTTPGHAMRAMDPLKAFGAVIGKALRPLQSGTGLVPILVALQ
jgi:hypothetical protein